jgi:hypothetical protein
MFLKVLSWEMADSLLSLRSALFFWSNWLMATLLDKWYSPRSICCRLKVGFLRREKAEATLRVDF